MQAEVHAISASTPHSHERMQTHAPTRACTWRGRCLLMRCANVSWGSMTSLALTTCEEGAGRVYTPLLGGIGGIARLEDGSRSLLLPVGDTPAWLRHRPHLAARADALVSARSAHPVDLEGATVGGGEVGGGSLQEVGGGLMQVNEGPRQAPSHGGRAHVCPPSALTALPHPPPSHTTPQPTLLKLPALRSLMAPALTMAASSSDSMVGKGGLRCMPCGWVCRH